MNGRSGCAAYQERLLEAAYEELGGEAMQMLAAHLATCEPCREEAESLRATRRRLRGALAAPSHDLTGTLVVMPRATRPALRWLRLAAAAALLLAVAIAFSRAEVTVGAGGTTVSFRLGGGSAAASPDPEAASTAVLAALRALRERDTLPEALAQELDRRAVAARESQDAALARLVDEIDRRRAQDLGFVLTQVGSLEQRTGVEMARTQQLLQYAVLAQDDAVDSLR